MTTTPRFDRFFRQLQTIAPQYRWMYKEDSWWMLWLGRLMFWNRQFSTEYATTVGSTTYFPKQWLDGADDASAVSLMAHEFRHTMDSSQHPILYQLGYLFPQLLAPLCLTLIPLNWIAAVAMSVLFLLPWPAVWRKNSELQAYVVSMLALNLMWVEQGIELDRRTKALTVTAVSFNQEFISSSYYFMWWWGVEKELNQAITEILDGGVVKKDQECNIIATAVERSK